MSIGLDRNALAQQLDQLVDGLAEQHFGLVDNFFTGEEVDTLLNEFEAYQQQDEFKKAGIGQQDDFQVNKKIRGDHIRWIEESDTHLSFFAEKIRTLIDFLNQTCYLGLKDFEAHFAVYPEGTFYKRHLDQFHQDKNRQITILCYLNKEWTEADGGQLRLFFPEGENEKTLDILPKAGRLLIFRSDKLEHEVLLTHKERYSIAGWLLDKPKTLSFLA
ncbi:2OG-Fe(II) oxygenase [Limibacter armeniacum]|uniref:2OG-Fe(II) oxygenase n=1 Tax=Limibacter armeniacum TaxID=466084 RepID=UPI002FE58FC2